MNVSWIALHRNVKPRGMWDQELPTRLFRMTGIPIEHTEVWGGLAVVFGGRHHVNELDRINERINRQESVFVVVTSDEEGAFPWWNLSHPNMRLWVQTPGRWHDRTFGVGPAPHSLSACLSVKDLDWYFAGQVTHAKRREAMNALSAVPRGLALPSEGFTQGLPPYEYIEGLSRAKLAPCPSGPVTPDTFRLYEALENGCLPIVDRSAPNSEDDLYWQRVYGQVPFPIVNDWASVDFDALLADYPSNANRAGSWWQQYQWGLASRWRQDLRELGETPEHPFTVLVSTSAVSKHPDTDVIDATIQSVRERTDAPMIVMVDGLRPDQSHLAERYAEYVRRVIWKCAHEWDATAVVFDSWQHQAAMTKHVLGMVDTSSILFMEHDTPLVNDIPLDQLAGLTDTGAVNVIRLHHEARILPDHEHLMLDTWDLGVPLHRTVQWSQRPHVANTGYYRTILERNFNSRSRTFIEDVLHSRLQTQGWGEHRVAIYVPEGNIQRSTHLDWRGADRKASVRF